MFSDSQFPNLITDLMCHPVEDDCIVSERKVMVRQTKLMLHINTIKNQNRRVVCPLATSPVAAPSGAASSGRARARAGAKALSPKSTQLKYPLRKCSLMQPHEPPPPTAPSGAAQPEGAPTSATEAEYSMAREGITVTELGAVVKMSHFALRDVCS